MIIDILENAQRYVDLHPKFAEAFAYLIAHCKNPPAPGKYSIQSDDIFAIVSDSQGLGLNNARLEAHRRYIDIQYTLNGDEIYGWKPVNDCREIEESYDDAKDFELFKDPPSTMIHAAKGVFVVFFPEDGHAPLCSDEMVSKIVIKVAV